MNQRLILVRKFLQEKNYIQNIPFIMVGIISGLICCLYAMVFNWAEHFGLSFLQNHFESFIILSPTLMIASFLMVRNWGPGASGSGIPQVMTCLEKSHSHLAEKFLTFRVLIVKIGSSLVAVLAGAAIGREGPSIQISAIIARLVGKMFDRWNIKVKTDQLLIAGAASGLAAAFNTPIGGIIYAVEELAQDHIKSYKNVLLLSVVIAGFTAQLILGRYLYLGFPQILPTMDISVLAVVSLVSFLSGFLGSIFSIFLLKLIQWRSSQSIISQIMIVATVGLLLVTIYHVFGERNIFSGKETINYVLFDRGPLNITEAFFRFFSPLLSSLTGIAGGVFAPALSAGAAFGGFMADVMNPSLKVILGLAGMIGFLTGVTRTPITSFVLVVEMTDKHSSVFPMMFAAFFGSLGAHILGNHSFYEATVLDIKSKHRVSEQ
jgi:H+/Cl- antiporter ClcA